MRRNGTGILATGAILGGAAIGVGATLALFGNPFDRAASEETECGSIQEVAATWKYWRNAATGEHGYGYFTACPRGFRYGFSYHPSHKPDGLTVKQTFMLPIRVRGVEMGAVEAGVPPGRQATTRRAASASAAPTPPPSRPRSGGDRRSAAPPAP